MNGAAFDTVLAGGDMTAFATEAVAFMHTWSAVGVSLLFSQHDPKQPDLKLLLSDRHRLRVSQLWKLCELCLAHQGHSESCWGWRDHQRCHSRKFSRQAQRGRQSLE